MTEYNRPAAPSPRSRTNNHPARLTKSILLPRLAFEGIGKNRDSYFPYMAACTFAVFAYFVFDSILYNDIMEQLPKAQYAWMLMRIGLVLLGIVFVPFLFYTNSFLVKRRGKELGLYSILGMEKKHIGIMMVLETIYIYLFVLAAGIMTGLVFSKLVFLLILNLSGFPVNVDFVFYPAAVKESAVFWAFISLLNLAVNIYRVGRANPADLMRKPRKGEKEPKRRWILAVMGIAALAAGYTLSFTTKLDSFIFPRFFLAVFLVVIGTYFIFTWGSIVILHMLKTNKRIFYQKENFITISGMFSRMKKSAASLINICIFATMVVITLTCTVALYAGTAGMLQSEYPYDLEIELQENEDSGEVIDQIKQLAETSDIAIDQLFSYRFMKIMLQQEEMSDHFTDRATGRYAYEGYYPCLFMTLDDFNACGQTDYTLSPGEVLLFSTGVDYGHDTIRLEDKEYRVKEELAATPMSVKAKGNYLSRELYIILPDETAWQECMDLWPRDSIQSGNNICILLSGPEEARGEYIRIVTAAISQKGNAFSYRDGYDGRQEMRAMNGGLLFVGIFFGIIFMLCMVLIMYYKQISEGFEDKYNYDIMQQVGMSDREVRSTIKKQIFMVFFFPLAGAVLHMAAGLPMTVRLLAAIRMNDLRIVIVCGIGVIIIFCLIYLSSYVLTARAYLRIVRQMR